MATAFLWQGFHHEWLREVLRFRLPHRISKLDSYIAAETDSEAEFHFGQATGVDGNVMEPQGFFTAIAADGLRVTRGRAELRWTDEIADENGVPCARSSISQAIPETGTAVLRGFRLLTRCDPAKQPADSPGNSHGMWPYVFSIALADGQVHVHIERGWTPNKGGIPGIEEKPLTRHLDFEVDVMYSVLDASADVMVATCGDSAVAEASVRRYASARAATAITGRGADEFPVAAVGLRGFGFELVPPTERKRHQHRGRYISAVHFGSYLEHYHPRTGVATLANGARGWAPVTVVRSDARYRIDPVLIQLRGPGATTSRTSGTAKGLLCCPSTDQAPFFSHWKRCGERKEHDVVKIAADFAACDR